MRILHLLASASITGPAELLLDDARALRGAGHEVVIGCDSRRPGNFAEAIRRDGFELAEELTLCPKPRLVEPLRDLARLGRRLAWADLVHCRFAHEHSLVYLATRAMRRRPALVRTAEIAKALRPGCGRGLAFRACDAVIVSCSDYAQRLVDEHRVPAERVHKLLGRVDAERFCPGDGSALRHELRVGPETTLFGIVSRIKSERRHELLVRAFARVARETPSAALAIVGRGELEADVRSLVNRLGLEGRVHFAGYRAGEALVDAYRAFDVKVWLAEGNDGTCRAVLEAMACGKPVVVGDQGPMKELVRDGEDGRTVVLEEQALAQALLSLTDRTLQSRMAASALARSRTFDGARRSAGLLAIYEKALRSRTRERAADRH